MKILHRYIFKILVRNLLLCLLTSVSLFLIFDFFDRIDNIMAEGASLLLTVQYFIYKVPMMLSHMLPVSMMVATILTFGILSKNSEVIAMRASGITLLWIARPLLYAGTVLCLFAFAVNEWVVPGAQRRSREIYNIDIRGKDKKGGYSQSEFWWRAGNDFYSAGVFDSRSKSLHELSNFQVSSDFKVLKRLDAEQVSWLDSLLGWNMSKVRQFVFQENKQDFEVKQFRGLPLPIPEKPQDFYEVRTDPDTMNFSQLRRFIKRQLRSGIDVAGYMADLYEKLAFPVFNLIVALVVLPFALKPARTRGMAGSVMAALVIGFSYYAVHSFSLALGRAELMPALLSAWLANLLMGFVAMVLMLGAEAP